MTPFDFAYCEEIRRFQPVEPLVTTDPPIVRWIKLGANIAALFAILLLIYAYETRTPRPAHPEAIPTSERGAGGGKGGRP